MDITLASGILAKFSEIKFTDNMDCLVSTSVDKQFFVKIEIQKPRDERRKIHDLEQEAGILKHLNDGNCRTCVKLLLFAKLTGEDLSAKLADVEIGLQDNVDPDVDTDFELKPNNEYSLMITEAVTFMPTIYTPDIAMAVIEQKKLGVWNGDLTVADIRVDSKTNCIKLVDYDQAIMLTDEQISMPNLAFFKWIDEEAIEKWAHFGMTSFLYNLNADWDTHFAAFFDGDCFNVGATHLFQSQETTLNKGKIYHSFRTEDIYADGERTLDDRRQFLDRIEFDKGERVLDVGCNAGLLCHYLEERGCDVWGIDIDESVIEGAQILANIVGKPNINFQCHDLDNGGPIGYFDTILLFSVIHHTANIRQNAERIAKFCDRIIIECRTQENGAKPVDGKWIQTTVWQHEDLDSLTNGLENLFPDFKFIRVLGQGDRDRYVLEFIKVST
ncbi:MAG: class I SAM-dependent methyltransferase [Rhodospirillales bacterium]|jgi:SAM-dependent methyltransferase|nr:class I SAM-dependent methyltransferase [Rhodospirillales bacterium]MBT4039406.1 class I SAM-dependent methyltransferase [Rhodospirillales bacterium]MBT4627168.1 class I SAM-dependent methyltransferase [Rhodospirillales bacterium]MBT5352460.1 class I SAM-dependent methyltransferase [Rhodospirillales bacterium]MBT5519548.1 class I SAM-dependent methyltransferase [Rhodospirillales bacterium]